MTSVIGRTFDSSNYGLSYLSMGEMGVGETITGLFLGDCSLGVNVSGE